MAGSVRLGPLLCITCARKVGWWFIDGRWNLRNWSNRKHHECAQ